MSKDNFEIKDDVIDRLFNKITPAMQRETDLCMNISAKIDSLLKKHNMSKSELARIAGVHESEVTRWVSGTWNFKIRTIAKIECAIGESIINIKL